MTWRVWASVAFVALGFEHSVANLFFFPLAALLHPGAAPGLGAALDNALRSAIVEIHPHLGEVELVNYKVRILDESHGTGAVTRVLIDASDGESSWGSIGVGENVIAASWQALVDSLEYAEQPGRQGGTGSG